MTLSKKYTILWVLFALLLTLPACGTSVLNNVDGVQRSEVSPRIVASPMLAQPQSVGYAQPELNTETYAYLEENGYKDTQTSPLSTFSIDVDTASYSNVRRMLRDNQLPEPGAVRIEELINYFSYDYPQPQGESPVAVYQELTDCPWNPSHQLLHLGLQAKSIDMGDAPQSNLVFLIDVSGSMYDNLTLVKKSLIMLTEQMNGDDRISIVVYAGASGVILPPTSAADKLNIEAALNMLEAGGSTAGSEGIELAYELAEKHLIKGGNNRIILATDGDFNVGMTSEDALVRLIEKKRKKGIFLSVLGFGWGNYNDVTAEALADHGNGNYAYIDNLLEAKKVLVDQVGGTLLTVAKDVKIQIEFNPLHVKSYRLIGYENRLLDAEDFANDKKDAGDMGAGHSVTALYEIIPQDGTSEGESALRYQSQTVSQDSEKTDELALVKYRYKKPNEDSSNIESFTVNHQPKKFVAASDNHQFSAAVAAWGMVLKGSTYMPQTDWNWIISTARHAKGIDSNGERAEFVRLVELTKILSPAKNF
ncbi:MAG: VWA domain-containing protein [Desulfuromonadales bacterium]|nr:VWA domain-containing protein [Desulfuromonadales bacterium]